jgi:SAM-dependent methyltransferase
VDDWEGYGIASYGDAAAAAYDRVHAPDAAAVACLARLAGPGPVLELGIGTGRLALPLAEHGLEVHGIDASAAMVAKLRAKPGGDRVTVTMGDFADVEVDGRFALVFVAFNTFFALVTAEAQQRCFANVARHLEPNTGRFVMTAFVPDPSRFVRDQHLEVAHVGLDGARLNASRHDAAAQRVDSLIMYVSNDGVQTWPARLRYAYPAELDAMATAAGFELEERWSSWSGEPFDETDSPQHVSVYRWNPSSMTAHRSGSPR